MQRGGSALTHTSTAVLALVLGAAIVSIVCALLVALAVGRLLNHLSHRKGDRL